MCALLLLPATPARASPPDSSAAWDLASKGRFLAVLAAAEVPPKPPDGLPPARAYLLGLCLVRVHRFSEARAYLELAKARDYAMPPGWERTEDLLVRVAQCDALRPALRSSYPPQASNPTLKLFAVPGRWGDEVAQDLPRLVEAAQFAFPDRLPATDIYLFDKRRVYDSFFRSLFGMAPVRSWQHGTGRVHAVVFCAEDQDGAPHPPAARARLPADLLHEYGHALCEARYGDLYIDSIPQWLNEGLADAVARGRYQALYQASPLLVRATYAKTAPPTYADMSAHLYEGEPTARYALARLMVDQLLGPRMNASIAPLLDEARRLQAFPAAMTSACKSSGEEVRVAVLRALHLPTEVKGGEPEPRR
jgi:hypothetical protein